VRILILILLIPLCAGCAGRQVSTTSGDYDKYSAVKLTTDSGRDLDPTWNNDGTKLAFVSNRNGNMDIYCINSDGTGLTQLTSEEVDEHDPAWSPDGTKIAIQKSEPSGAPKYLWVMDADGSNGRAIATAEAGAITSPAWSPDSAKIAFSKEGDIYTIHATGTGETQLTTDGDGTNDANNDFFPCFNHDGTKILYSKGTTGSEGTAGNADVYVMNSDGSSPEVFYSDPSYENEVFQEGWSWLSPYGILLFAKSPTGSHPAIWHIDQDGISPEAWFYSAQAANGDPAWSRDSTKISFMSERSGNPDIWIATISD